MNNDDNIVDENSTQQISLYDNTGYDLSTASSETEINWNEPNLRLPTPPPISDEILPVVRPKGEMADKLANAAPYNFFLTTVTDSEPTHNEPLSVTFQGIIKPMIIKIHLMIAYVFFRTT